MKSYDANEVLPRRQLHTDVFLHHLGVPAIPPLLSPFDPGYDPLTLESHLRQSSRLMSILKLSMACWLIADEGATRQKIEAANRYRIPVVTGGGPFEIAVAQHRLPEYLDLCADIGVTRIECGSGFTSMTLQPKQVVSMARQRNLEVQYELGKKHEGSFTSGVVDHLIDEGQQWLDAGALQLVVEARESAAGVGLFDMKGNFNAGHAERIAKVFGLHTVMFEAPNKPSQFMLLDHFGRDIHLCNVRLEEVLRVEIYRRGLHSDAFSKENLRPSPTNVSEKNLTTT